jgi:hypothetical protein
VVGNPEPWVGESEKARESRTPRLSGVRARRNSVGLAKAARRKSRTRCAWSEYPAAAANRGHSTLVLSRNRARVHTNRCSRAYALGDMPSSRANRSQSCFRLTPRSAWIEAMRRLPCASSMRLAAAHTIAEGTTLGVTCRPMNCSTCAKRCSAESAASRRVRSSLAGGPRRLSRSTTC